MKLAGNSRRLAAITPLRSSSSAATGRSLGGRSRPRRAPVIGRVANRGGCCKNPPASALDRFKGGRLRKRRSHRPRTGRPWRRRRDEPLWHPLLRTHTSFSAAALCNSLVGGPLFDPPRYGVGRRHAALHTAAAAPAYQGIDLSAEGEMVATPRRHIGGLRSRKLEGSGSWIQLAPWSAPPARVIGCPRRSGAIRPLGACYSEW
jgi:hypothetical protein